METFVHRRNGRAGETRESGYVDVNRNFDDLKLALPIGRAAPSSHPPGANVQTSNRLVPVKREGDADDDPVSARRLSGEHGAFYDTDASSIDQTSTAASVNGEVVNAADDSQGEECSSDVDEEQNPEVGEVEPSEAELRARARALERELQTGAAVNGTGWPPIKGDSYPSTTSGNPSVSEVPNGAGAQEVGQQLGIRTTVYNLPNRQSNQRRSLPTAAPPSIPHAQTPASAAHAMHNQAEPFLTSRMHGSIQDPISQISPGFMYAKTQQQKHVVAPPPKPQHNATGHASAPTASSNTVQPSTRSTNGARSHHLISGQQQQHEEKRRDRELLQNVSNIAQTGQHRQNPVVQEDQRVKFAPTADHLINQSEETGYVQGDSRNTRRHEPEKALDYDVQELYGMDYHALKREPFDIDPNAQRLDDSQHHEAITERMAALRGMQADAQTHFFSGLSIKEWEDGGDWFLDQFSTILNQLKDVRQQRRKAAQEYEDEIEGRFKAVGQKRKQIDVALSQMKESGGKVLQGTPKKSKTK